MRCEHCGNLGARNGEYCWCVYGTQLKFKNGDVEIDPEMEKIMKAVVERSRPGLQRLSED